MLQSIDILRPLAVPKMASQFRDDFKLVERARPALSDDAKNKKIALAMPFGFRIISVACCLRGITPN